MIRVKLSIRRNLNVFSLITKGGRLARRKPGDTMHHISLRSDVSSRSPPTSAGKIATEYNLPLWSKKSEGVDIFGLPIRRLIQACCNGSILRSRGYYLLLACPGQFDTDRNVSDIIG